MADMKMKKFLTEYYRRMIFREMSHEELLQFGEYIDKKKLTDEQKIWADELLAKDATGAFEKDPSGTVYAPKNLPDAAVDLNKVELTKIYEAFQEAHSLSLTFCSRRESSRHITSLHCICRRTFPMFPEQSYCFLEICRHCLCILA